MPFDAGVMAAVVKQFQDTVLGARIDKIYQPEKDEIVLNIRLKNQSKKILLSACPGKSRVGFCVSDRENPSEPPMFCMLLRKHLSGGHILDVKQIGFDRAVEFKISSTDDMGFVTQKYLVCEIMGTYSNIVFLDEKRKIVGVLHPVSLSPTNKRQVLCGFEYENPPRQEGKTNALDVTKEQFVGMILQDVSNGKNGNADKYLVSNYEGLSPLIAREIVYRATSSTSQPLANIDVDKLWFNFNKIYSDVKNGIFEPCLIRDLKGKVVDVSFCPIRQLGAGAITDTAEDMSDALEKFFEQKDRQESIKNKAQDILRLLTNASSRIIKKQELQKESLSECQNMDTWKCFGDLITANIYMLKKGQTEAQLVNYYDENFPTVTIKLDTRFTPSQNAQFYYKKYNKAKSAQKILTEQLEQARLELEYIDTVFDSLTKAQTESDLAQIRAELSMTGYARKLENLQKSMKKNKKDPKSALKAQYNPMKFKTSGGYEVLCGKNNLQNDYITTVVASRDDYWFHIKKAPGSHVIMRCGKDEPSAKDFTECAMIAAFYSSERELSQAPVDYTRVRNVKKPSGSKPGFVIYETNYTAFVTADEAVVESLKVK